jgi:dipeptidyl aminopeptidase/acylaminoacyl peptidase
MDMLREPVTAPYRGFSLGFMADCPHDNREAYLTASPITQLTPQMPPLLLVHGLADDVVPADHARWMVDAARQVTAPVEMILLDGVGHTGGEPDNSMHAPGWQGMLDFYALHLGG